MKNKIIWMTLKCMLSLSLISSLSSGCSSLGSGLFKANVITEKGTTVNIEAQAKDLNKGIQKIQETK